MTETVAPLALLAALSSDHVRAFVADVVNIDDAGDDGLLWHACTVAAALWGAVRLSDAMSYAPASSRGTLHSALRRGMPWVPFVAIVGAAKNWHPLLTEGVAEASTFLSAHPSFSLTCAVILLAVQLAAAAGLFNRPIPSLDVPMTAAELCEGYEAFGPPDLNMTLRDASMPDMLQCYDPATAQRIGAVPIVTPDEVRARIARARAAQRSWKDSTFAQRRHVLRIFLKFILEHQDDIVRLCCRDSGKTELGASFGEVLPTCEKIQWMIDNGERILSPQPRAAARIMAYKEAWVEYHPFGVLGVISPFNYPFTNFLNHIISGLFSGNAVVCKLSEHTSWSGAYFHRFVSAALMKARESGAVPTAHPDLVQVVTGFADTGSALVSGGVDKIIFTGSTHVGRLVMKGAADAGITPCVLELGGKDPFVVLEDADLDGVFKLLMRGCFQNCGQNCIGVERVYVQSSVYDRFLDMAAEKVGALKQGFPLSGESCDLGATTMPGQIDIIEGLVFDALEKGARVLCGGECNAEMGPGLFFEPTLLVDVDHTMRIAKEEAFGPLMVVMPFESEVDLVRLANDSEFGLCSSIWSGSKVRATKLAEKLHVGMSNINDYGVNYLVQSLPFGGVKKSGFGRFGGPEGLRECCVLKSVTRDALPLVMTPLMMPPVIDYPVGPHAVPFNKGLLHMTYGASVAQKLSGLFTLLKSLIDFGAGSSKEQDADELRAQTFPSDYFDAAGELEEEDEVSKTNKKAKKKKAPKSKKKATPVKPKKTKKTTRSKSRQRK